jgi:hypothetical protein
MTYAKYIGAGADSVQVAFTNSDGVFAGIDNLDASDTGSSSSMLRIEGANAADIQLGEPERVAVSGDDTAVALFTFENAELPPVVIEVAENNQTFNNLIQSTTAVSEGGHVITPFGLSGPVIPRMATLIMRQIKSTVSGSRGAAGFEGLLLPNTEWRKLGSPRQSRGVSYQRYFVTINYADRLLDGRLVSAIHTDVPGGKLLGWEISSLKRFSYSVLIGNNSLQKIVTANKPVSTATSIATLETTGFAVDTVAGVVTTAPYGLTLTGTPGSGKIAVGRYQFENWT